MPKLTMTRGLPASGKSTWAKEQVLNGNGRVKRVNKDDLRNMIDCGEWDRNKEDSIVWIRNRIVEHYLGKGYDVIVDDTNFAPVHAEVLCAIATDPEYDAAFEIKDFTHVPLQTCLDRDSARPNPVGEDVIRRMHRQYLKGQPKPYTPPVYDEGKPFCIILDIDGTIAHSTGRSMYDTTRVHEDAVDPIVREVVWRYAPRNIMDDTPDTYIVVVSGREDSCKDVTEQWLKDNNIPYDEIHMRKEGDKREDSIVKKEIFDAWIRDRYNVRFVLDDRNRVVQMWREEGLKVLQVAEGDF